MKQKIKKEQKIVCEHKKYVYKARTPNSTILDRYCKYCDKLIKKDANPDTFENFVRKFIHGKLGDKKVCGYYKVSKDNKKLVYTGIGRNHRTGTSLLTQQKPDILALKLKDGRIIGNASKLHRCGSYSKGDEAPAQRVMFDLNIAMIPFNVFEEAKLNIQKAKIIEQGKEEEFNLPKLEWNKEQAQLQPVVINVTEFFRKEPKTDDKKIVLNKDKTSICKQVYDKKGKPKKDKDGYLIEKKIYGWNADIIDKTKLANRHFVGAMLIELKGKQFLFDVDRNELKHYRFNPFLSELPTKVKKIKEAYEILKPKEVRIAERKGIKVQRQGEWFFIPSKLPKQPKEIKEIQKQRDNPPRPRQHDINTDDLSIRSIYDGDRIRIKNIKFDRILPKYRKQLRKRIGDYNNKVTKYKQLTKVEEELQKKYQIFDYGGKLRAGTNRPNSVSKLVIHKGINYVKGRISHDGREHEDINLNVWHKAIPNTATKSFTITGNID